jgi:hypothetical protein
VLLNDANPYSIDLGSAWDKTIKFNETTNCENKSGLQQLLLKRNVREPHHSSSDRVTARFWDDHNKRDSKIWAQKQDDCFHIRQKLIFYVYRIDWAVKPKWWQLKLTEKIENGSCRYGLLGRQLGVFVSYAFKSLLEHLSHQFNKSASTSNN